MSRLKNLPRLSWKLATLVIVGPQLRTPLEPPDTIVLCFSMGFEVALNWDPTMHRVISVSCSITLDRCNFFLVWICLFDMMFACAELILQQELNLAVG